jgi:hypothetical protein
MIVKTASFARSLMTVSDIIWFLYDPICFKAIIDLLVALPDHLQKEMVDLLCELCDIFALDFPTESLELFLQLCAVGMSINQTVFVFAVSVIQTFARNPTLMSRIDFQDKMWFTATIKVVHLHGNELSFCVTRLKDLFIQLGEDFKSRTLVYLKNGPLNMKHKLSIYIDIVASERRNLTMTFFPVRRSQRKSTTISIGNRASSVTITLTGMTTPTFVRNRESV